VILFEEVSMLCA